jgi:Phage integrase, N-terminal SAM-like domain
MAIEGSGSGNVLVPLDSRAVRLDGWVVAPDTATRRKRGRDSGRRTENMTQPLTELVEQFCNFQRKQRGKTEGGVRSYRWNLEQFLVFIRSREGRLAKVTDLTASAIQAWMDDMAAEDLALSTMRVRQSTVSSFCAWS